MSSRPAARVALGRIVGVHGVRGWVKVFSWTRPSVNLFDYPTWWVDHGGGFEVRLLEGRSQGKTLAVRLADADGNPLDDRDRVAALVGCEIRVERAAMPPPPSGSYYWTDLIGLTVLSVSGAALGLVEALTDNGAQDVLVVVDGERRRLIPFVVGPIVRSVSLEDGKIVVDWDPDY